MDEIKIIGNVGSDAELRFTDSGQPVCSFSIAANRRWKKDGEKKQKTVWYRCTIWGKFGETMSQYLTKGAKVYVSGSLAATEKGHPRIFEAEGVTRCNFEVTVKDLELLGGNRRSSSPSASNGSSNDTDFDFGDLSDDDFLDF